MLLFSFIWFCRSNHMISIYLWYAFLSVFWYLYIYIYIMFCWVELFEFHCVQSISYLYYIFDMYFCVIRSVKPHRNCKKPTYDNKHKQEPTWNLSNNKKNWTNMFKKNFLELSGQPGHRHIFTRKNIFFTRKSKISNTKSGQNVDA